MEGTRYALTYSNNCKDNEMVLNKLQMEIKKKLQKKIRKIKNKIIMALNSNLIESAQTIVDSLNTPKVKVIKKDSGLLEREKLDDNKIILAEDNRQILLG